MLFLRLMLQVNIIFSFQDKKDSVGCLKIHVVSNQTKIVGHEDDIQAAATHT